MRTEPFTQEEIIKMLQPNHLERIAHALEVIAARVGFMETAISLHEGSKVKETDPETINVTVGAIKNGGNC